MKKRAVRRNLFQTGTHWYFSDPYVDEYTTMECTSCQRLIHYGEERCPYCGSEIDEESEEFKSARKRKKTNAIVGVVFVLFGLIVSFLLDMLFERS